MRNLPGIAARLMGLISASASGASARGPEEERRLAAAALLVEAARQDGEYAFAEKAEIGAVLRQHFGLSAGDADELVAEAETAQGEATDLFRFTRRASELNEAERETLIEMLWRVVLADGALHDYEASLMRRVAGLLHVSDHASAAARRRAMIGQSGGCGGEGPSERKE